MVYEAFSNPQDRVELLAKEYGDEIILGRTARVVTRIEFDYYADFIANGQQSAKFTLYKNDGPFWHNNHEFSTPKTVIWDSSFPVLKGQQKIALTVPYVTVPKNLTWTVKFSGLTMVVGDYAGLNFYGTATTGSGYTNDFWVKLLGSWTPMFHDGIFNNFGCKIFAVESVPIRPELTIAQEGTNVRISWPASASTFVLESKSALNNGPWEPVPTARTAVGETFQSLVPVSGDAQIFRLNTEPEPLLTASAAVGGLKIQWPSTLNGQTLQGRASLTSGDWVNLNTPSRATGGFFETIIPSDTGIQFFRLMRIYERAF